jgi:hypothetical protein
MTTLVVMYTSKVRGSMLAKAALTLLHSSHTLYVLTSDPHSLNAIMGW